MRWALMGLFLMGCGSVTAPRDCGPVIEGPLAINIEVCSVYGCTVTQDTLWTRYKECVNPPRVVIVDDKQGE